MKKFISFSKLFIFISIFAVYFSGCSDSITNPTITTASKYQAHTEAEFNTNSNLKAIPGAVVYDDLEHLNTPSSLLGDDTGPIGEDVISYYYSDSATHRFKIGADAKFKVRLVNESGAVIYQLNNPGDTTRVSIPAGNYKLYLTSLVNYGSDSTATQPVFIQPDLDAIASGGVQPQVGYNKQDLNTLLTTNKCIKCDLTNLKLNNKNLAGADLSYAYMENSYMQNVNLSGAIFYHTNLNNATGSNSSYKSSVFTLAILNNAYFTQSDFSRVTFQKLNWYKTTFLGCDLKYSILDSGASQNCFLPGSDLSKVTASNVHFYDTNCDSAKFINSTFSNVWAINMEMEEVNMDSAKFINDTYFQRCIIRDAKLRYATFLNFHGLGCYMLSNLCFGSTFTNVDFSTTNLSQSNLTNTLWNNVDISAANMCQQIRTGASFTNMHYNSDTDCWP